MAAYADRMGKVLGGIAPFFRFMTESAWAQAHDHPDHCDFVFGNPHEPPLPGFVAALQEHLPPRNDEWFAYKLNEDEPREVVAEALRRGRKVDFAPEDIFLTNGAFAGLTVALKTVVDPGDEVIFISPPWFFYEAIILDIGAQPVRVQIDMATYDLDVDAIAAAITERTAAIIVNSPHNPTGKIYPAATLTKLASVLCEASAKRGRPIYLVSDEAYSRIVYDGNEMISPTTFYDHTLLIYTYGKTLLTPGQRVGYIALPPRMPEADRESLRVAIMAAQLVTGFAFPNALLQHSMAELESLSIDIEQLQAKRDRLVDELRAMGYDVHLPEGTFYLVVRSPLADDFAFIQLLAEEQVFCLPGSVTELPGTFRISLTANDAMIERALPGFRRAREKALAQAAPSPA